MTIANQIALINDLITKSRDAENGYKEVIKHAQSETLKSIFTDCAQDRFRFRHELEVQVQNLGGMVTKEESTMANIHRAWIDLKTAVASNEDNAIIDEVLRGEKNALERYREVLDQLPITAAYYTTLIDQRNAIRTTVKRMQNLKHITEAVS